MCKSTLLPVILNPFRCRIAVPGTAAMTPVLPGQRDATRPQKDT